MPTFIKRTRCASDDLKAISIFIREEQNNWTILHRQLRNLRGMFYCYLQAIDNPIKYKTRRRYDKSIAKIFYALYDSKAKCLSYIDEFRRLATKTLGGCPYCGLPRNITLDHYLPRKVEAFPEYSILSVNLVPACSECQNKKSDFYALHKKSIIHVRGARFKAKPKLSDTRRRPIQHITKRQNRTVRKNFPVYRLLHPYLDSFLSKPVLSVHPANRPDSFSVQASGHLHRAERELLNFHLEKLNVSERASSAISRCRNAVIRDLSSIPITFDRDSVRRELPRLLKSALERAALAPNTIEPTYIRSLMTNTFTLDDLIVWSEFRNEPNVLAAMPVVL